MIEPTERLLWAVVGVAIVGAVGFAVPVIGAFAPWCLGGLALLAVIDGVLAPSPRAVRVRRTFPERPQQGRTGEVVLEVELAASVTRVVDVDVTDTLPGVERPWWSTSVRLSPGALAVVRRSERWVTRGPRSRGRFALRTTGPLGLLRRRQRRDAEGDDVDIGLDLAVIVARARRLVRGSESDGARRKRAIERGRDFDALREYRRGDDVRLVDWKATARRGGLVVKELVPETRQDVVLVLDAGRQMVMPDSLDVSSSSSSSSSSSGPVAGARPPRFEQALASTLVLAAAALEKGDRVGLVVLADEVLDFVGPAGGAGQLKRLADVARAHHALPVEPAYQELASFLIARLKRRALITLVTDVVDEVSARALGRAMLSLRGRHLVAVAAMGDPGLTRSERGDHHGDLKDQKDLKDLKDNNDINTPDDVDTPNDDVIALRPAAAHRLLGHRRRALAAVESTGAIVIDAVSQRSAAAVVDAYLDLKAQGRL